MSILITGVSGFIGRHLSERLSKDYDVIGVDKHFSLDPEGWMFYVNILDPLFEIVFKHEIDTVFHLAAHSDIQSQSPESDFNDTFLTTYKVLEACRRYGIKDLVFTSSGSVYGDAPKGVDENFRTAPISFYAAAKVASEAFINAYCENYGMKALILRLPNVVGEKATHGVILDFIKKMQKSDTLEVLGDGSQEKPYMYISEVLDAMLYLWKEGVTGTFNIAPDDTTKVSEIAELFTDKIKYTGGDRGWVGDCPKYFPYAGKLHKYWGHRMTSLEAVKLAKKELEDEIRAGMR